MEDREKKKLLKIYKLIESKKATDCNYIIKVDSLGNIESLILERKKRQEIKL